VARILNPDVTVSDHALVRWLERAHEIPMPFFRQELAALVREPARLGASSVKINGLSYVIRNGVLVTVTPIHANYPRQVDEAAE
jgi:hypothetical protein